ncbi:sodium:alanine symporter family protein [Chitinimonas sp. BJB300]|nr:sodium:alanine symporter family protein [Chitinimonas sp. BJB300]TSJ88662.1 alanine:cation symporter family protein [Chitinimonas sp. BJB300]
MIDPINSYLWGYILVYLLLTVGVFFTFRFSFLQFRSLKRAMQVTFIKAKPDEISPFQAFATGLASRVGTGNLAGVATAISLGGPGAIFWMWCTALLGMSSAFVEATLAQIFKVRNEDATFRGGPAYYISQGLGSRTWGVVFAISLLVAFGFSFNALQSNSISDALYMGFGIAPQTSGYVVTILTALIIFGGAHRIGKVAEWLVPIMATLYLMVAFYALVTNIGQIPALFDLIITNAFNGQAAVGGVAGASIKAAMEMGVKRGLFSNEAGMGSAPNAAASASTAHPVNQGLLQMLGVFIDTIIICSATAFVILLSDAYVPGSGVKGAALTQAAVSFHIGSAGAGFMAIVIFMFAFTSILGNYAYAESNMNFIYKSKTGLTIFRLLVLLMVLFGSTSSLPLVWDIADVCMGVMVIINLVAILFLSKFALAAWKDYGTQLKAGDEPVFKSKTIPGLDAKLQDNCWH